MPSLVSCNSIVAQKRCIETSFDRRWRESLGHLQFVSSIVESLFPGFSSFLHESGCYFPWGTIHINRDEVTWYLMHPCMPFGSRFWRLRQSSALELSVVGMARYWGFYVSSSPGMSTCPATPRSIYEWIECILLSIFSAISHHCSELFSTPERQPFVMSVVSDTGSCKWMWNFSSSLTSFPVLRTAHT